MKPEIRVLGIDDVPFQRTDKEVLVVGAFFRGGHFMDGVLSTKVERDGTNATEKVIDMVKKPRFYEQLKAILIDGIAFGGFNVLDIEKIVIETGIPTITVTRTYPDFESIKATLSKIGMAEKYKLMENAGIPRKVELNKGACWIQFKGCDFETVKEIIKITSWHGNLPEPLRIAHIIGQGIVFGESKGNA